MQRTTTTPAATSTAETRQGISPLHDYESAAPLLRCSPRMVRKLVETRQLASVKVGALVRIEPAAIERYIEAHRRPALRSGGGGHAA